VHHRLWRQLPVGVGADQMDAQRGAAVGDPADLVEIDGILGVGD
jgi:hypothetical protein